LDNNYKSLTIRKKIGDKSLISESYSDIGWIYLDLAKSGTHSNRKKILLDSTYKYGMMSFQIAKELGDPLRISPASQLLSEVYSEMKQYKEAFEMHLLYKQMEDSVHKAETNQAIVQSESDKKESIAMAEQEKKDAVADEEKRKQKIITWSVVSGLLLVILFAGFIFRSLRITRKQKQIIEVQKTEVEKSKHIIEEKNKDITDSINYAKRIQRAMLPHRKDIWTAFPQSFVLFKPKDIVSGDFYFFHQDNKLSLIAAADCTGHGVPGAFMSMIAAEKLKDAVQFSLNISDVLSHLNKGIKISLKQSETDESATRDGMDIALCSVDSNARIVKYAGANRPIWIIRNGSTAVEEIKATKKAIGGFTEDSQHFDSHEIKFEQGDTFYLSTDGFADTFGKQDKKLTTKKFKEILLSIQDKSLKEQEHHLDNFIEDWKGGTEQVDDILVIGVRL